MTVTDWARFITLHLRSDPANPNRRVDLLSPRAFEHLHRASPGETYAPGWAVDIFDPAKGARPDDKGMVFGHGGSNGYWYCKVLVAPEIDLAVLVVCNRGGAAVGGKAVAAVAVELMQKFTSNPKTSK